MSLLRTPDVAAQLSISESRVRELFADGTLPAWRPGKSWITTQEALNEHVTKKALESVGHEVEAVPVVSPWEREDFR